MRRLSIALFALSVVPSAAIADSLQLKGGDRITGQVTAAGKRAYRITTPYGRLLVPTEQIERILYDDGREEVFVSRSTASARDPLRLVLVVTGDSFWQAWDPHDPPADATLRLLVTLDAQAIAAYVDPQLDRDIRGAIVNTFAFEPAQTTRTSWQDAHALPPEAKPGNVRLPLDLPREKLGRHRVGVAYQWNAGNKDAPDWRDVSGASLEVDLQPNAPTVVRIEQSRGEMSFGGAFRKGRMRKTETFQIRPVLDRPDYAAPPASP